MTLQRHKQSVAGVIAAAVVALPGAGFVYGQAQTFRVGEKVLVEASGHWVPCTVAEAGSAEMVMRVDCEAYPKLSRAAGRYIVHDTTPSGIRRASASAPAPTSNAPATTAPATSSTAAAAGGGGSLKIGEYACYGTGSQILAGLGFKVLPGGRYTDLDGKNAGTYSISGGNITFHGGHMEGVQGRDLKGHNFRIGTKAVCEPF